MLYSISDDVNELTMFVSKTASLLILTKNLPSYSGFNISFSSCKTIVNSSSEFVLADFNISASVSLKPSSNVTVYTCFAPPDPTSSTSPVKPPLTILYLFVVPLDVVIDNTPSELTPLANVGFCVASGPLNLKLLTPTPGALLPDFNILHNALPFELVCNVINFGGSFFISSTLY